MVVLYCLLFVVALAFFVASALKVAETRINFQGAGLFFFTLVPFIQMLRQL